MSMSQRIGVAVVGLIACVGALILLYGYTSQRVDTSVIDYISQLQTSPNKFIDVSGDIGVSSANDIGYLVNSDYNIVIYYGKQVIEMNRNCFNNEVYRNKLAEIGVRVYTKTTEDGIVDYKVTYWDVEVERFSRVY